jgi:hypothetical protein
MPFRPQGPFERAARTPTFAQLGASVGERQVSAWCPRSEPERETRRCDRRHALDGAAERRSSLSSREPSSDSARSTFCSIGRAPYWAGWQRSSSSAVVEEAAAALRGRLRGGRGRGSRRRSGSGRRGRDGRWRWGRRRLGRRHRGRGLAHRLRRGLGRGGGAAAWRRRGDREGDRLALMGPARLTQVGQADHFRQREAAGGRPRRSGLCGRPRPRRLLLVAPSHAARGKRRPEESRTRRSDGDCRPHGHEEGQGPGRLAVGGRQRSTRSGGFPRRIVNTVCFPMNPSRVTDTEILVPARRRRSNTRT